MDTWKSTQQQVTPCTRDGGWVTAAARVCFHRGAWRVSLTIKASPHPPLLQHNQVPHLACPGSFQPHMGMSLWGTQFGS